MPLSRSLTGYQGLWKWLLKWLDGNYVEIKCVSINNLPLKLKINLLLGSARNRSENVMYTGNWNDNKVMQALIGGKVFLMYS